MKNQLPEEPLDNLSSVASHRAHYQDDEIDLKELVVALWQGKITIIITTVICTALAIFYALSAVEKWAAEAVITEPELSDFSPFQKMVNNFQPIFDVYLESGSILVSNKLDGFTSPLQLKTTFLAEFSSRENKKEFLSAYADFRSEQKLLLVSEESVDNKKGEAKLYNEWYEKIALVKNKDESYQLIGKGNTSNKSYQLLSEYIRYIESKTRELIITNLMTAVDAKSDELIQQKALFTQQAKDRLYNELLKAKYALQIAKAAGLTAPQRDLSSNEELFIINMGSTALQQKVNVLTSLTELSIIEPRLQQINSKLKQLDILKIDAEIEFDVYRFIEPPQEPLSRTSPKRSLIAILGVLLGGMLGCGIVLVRFAFREKDTI